MFRHFVNAINNTKQRAARWLQKVDLSKYPTHWLTNDKTSFVFWDGSQYVALGSNSRLAFSPNGTDWTYSTAIWDAGVVSGPTSYVNTPSLLVVGFSSAFIATSTDGGETWVNRKTALLASGWNSIAVVQVLATNGTVLVAGNSGTFALSYDGGVTWTLNTSLLSSSWSGQFNNLIWTGTQFVASGIGRIATSPDGITWTYQGGLLSTAYGGATTNVLTWNGSQLLVAGQVGRVATSPDGVTWTYQGGLASTAWSTATVLGGIWDGSQYVLAGANYTATSPDGVTWTTTAAPTASWASIAKGPSNYSMVGNISNLPVWATSTDAANWTTNPGAATEAFGPNQVLALAQGGGRIVAAGQIGRVSSSVGGLIWDYSGTLTTQNIITMQYLNGKFIGGGNGSLIVTSPDGINWTTNTNLASTGYSTSGVSGLAYNGSVFVAVGGTGCRIATSPDGDTWTYQGNLSATTWSTASTSFLTWLNGTFIVVGSLGRVATSPDGITWTYQGGLAATTWATAACTGGIIVDGVLTIHGSSGRLAQTTDGINWTYVGTLAASAYGPTTADAMMWTGTEYIVAGSFGRVARSPDLITWTSADVLRTAPFSDLNPRKGLWTGKRAILAGTTALLAIA